MKRFGILGVLAACLALVGGQGETDVSSAVPGALEIVSVSSSEALGNGQSLGGELSADGRFVAFYSSAPLVPGDVCCGLDVFVRDRAAGTTEAISVTPEGATANLASRVGFAGSMSSDGRYVVFWTNSSSILPGGSPGVYVRDRDAGTSEYISQSTGGVPAIGQTEGGWISPDGRYVAFQSVSSNLVAGDTNGTMDSFIRDRLLGTTTIVSVTTAGAIGDGYSSAGSMTLDGRYVLFYSQAANLWGPGGDPNPGNAHNPDLFVRDLLAGTTTGVELTPGSGDAYPAIPGDARYHPWSYQVINQTYQVYLRDLVTGSDERIDVSTEGVSADGRSSSPSMTPDARYVAFESSAGNLVPNDNNGRDVFRRDRQTGETIRVSVTGLGGDANSSNHAADISDDGSIVTFYARACNLAPQSDWNRLEDVYLHDLSGVGAAPSDPDCDGFTTTIENFMGTDPNDSCPATINQFNDEPPPDAWPLDFNDQGYANTGDIGFFVPKLGSSAPGPPYQARFDFNANGVINTVDVARFIPFLNQICYIPPPSS